MQYALTTRSCWESNNWFNVSVCFLCGWVSGGAVSVQQSVTEARGICSQEKTCVIQLEVLLKCREPDGKVMGRSLGQAALIGMSLSQVGLRE